MNQVYAYTILLTVIGPEERGRELAVAENDETIGVLGKKLEQHDADAADDTAGKDSEMKNIERAPATV